MQRITITIDDALLEEVDRLIAAQGYQNRSEAIRDLVRAGLAQSKTAGGRSAQCVASLAYIYDRKTRELPKRLANAHQDHHDLSVATMRVALDHDSCMEVSVLKGPTDQVEGFAESIMVERGVRHGRLAIIPAEIETGRHAHGGGHPHPHQHIRVW